MQYIWKLNCSTAFPIYDWFKYNRPNLHWVNNDIVSELDRDAFWGIVLQLVAMGHHMRSGAWVCIPVVVSIELEWWEWIRGITGMKTCISCSLDYLPGSSMQRICSLGLVLLPVLMCYISPFQHMFFSFPLGPHFLFIDDPSHIPNRLPLSYN